jgi:ABC-type dipeptide/oligopeptide/nickel transport system permease component
MIETIVNFFKTAWDYITNTITGLVGMVASFVSANQVLTDIMAYAPAVLSAAVGLTITAFIIKFILGR